MKTFDRQAATYCRLSGHLEVLVGNNIEIHPVQSPKQLMDFIKFPWKIYHHDPYWVPPLLMDRKKNLDAQHNPFFKENPSEFYLAYRNGEMVGRVAAILNRQHNQYHQDKTGFFGFLEAINDQKVFKALLDTVERWLKERGCDRIVGPMNPSSNDEVGFLLQGYDSPPYFMMPHTPSYYILLMESSGYTKAKDLFAYFVDENSFVVSERLVRISNAIQKKFPVKIRTVDLKNFGRELEVVRDIYNNAWAPNWGFVPMTTEEFDFVANDFKQIIDPEIVLVAEYKSEAVGFLLALPNYNELFIKIRNGKLFPTGIFKFLWYKHKIKGIRVLTLGVKQEYQAMGLGALFYKEIFYRGKARGYRSAEMSWILEDNDLMNRGVRLVGGRVYKKYRIYEKTL